MTATLWSPDAPTLCACAATYQPQLVKGRLVKGREPAWRMDEQTRDPACLQDKVEAASPGIVDRVRDRLAGSGWDPVPHAWQRRGPS